MGLFSGIFGPSSSTKEKQTPTKETKRKNKYEPTLYNGNGNGAGPLIGTPIPQNYKTIERYALNQPFADAVLAEDPIKKIPTYFIDEVPLTEEEKIIFNNIITTLQVEVKAPRVGMDPRLYFEEQAQRAVKRYKLIKRQSSQVSWAKLLYYAERDMVGFGALDPLMRDPNIEDISLDSVNRPVFVYHKSYESIGTNLVFPTDELLDDMIVRLVHMSGKHVSSAFPIVDATLPGKHRLAATFRREVSPQGSTMTIRKFREDPITIIDLINFGTIDYYSAAYAWLVIESRAAALVVGATASGKTTFLNALLSMINPNAKVVTIEEVQEINIHHVNWSPLVSRLSYGLTRESSGEISLFHLVKAAMRMRPDILVVGEVRGEEAYTLFQAISTGHGGIATLHGDDSQAAIQRLISKPMDVAPAYINFLDLIFTVRRVAIPNLANPDSPRFARRLISLDEIMDVQRSVRVFEWNPKIDKIENYLDNSVKLPSLAKDKGKSIESMMEEIENRVQVLRWLISKRIRNFVDVSTIFSQYHSDPKAILAMIRREGSGSFVGGIEQQIGA